MIVNREKVLVQLKELKPLLNQKYGVVKLGLFGSVARGDNTENSDIDILIEVKKPKFNLLDFVELKQFLEEKLNCKVDLVMEKAIKPRLRKSILSEVIYV
jgi:hypothetical protein